MPHAGGAAEAECERTSPGMVPTEQGARLVDRARRALAEIERARAEISPRAGGLTGIVAVGILESAMDLVVAPLMEAVRRDFSHRAARSHGLLGSSPAVAR